MGPRESTSHLHITVELNGEAIVLHLDGFHAGLPHPKAAGPIMQNHLQVLLLVLKQDVRTAASQLEILPIKGHNVLGRAAHAHTWTGEQRMGVTFPQTPIRAKRQRQVLPSCTQLTELRAEWAP